MTVTDVTTLKPDRTEVPSVVPAASVPTSIELFAGAGGLALGCQLAGFHAIATLERNSAACDTLRENKARGHKLAADWLVHEGDVREFDWAPFEGVIDLVAGGPPCQPFSTGGLGRAASDDRNMFPATADIVARLRPKAFIIENVRGLARKAFAEYYEYIQRRLALPEITAKSGEDWPDHLSRLRKAATQDAHYDFAYDVVATLVNAADYGVPQQRHRVFIIGFRSDLEVEWRFPSATHSREALLHAQWLTGNYWEEHEIPVGQRSARPNTRVPEILDSALPEQRWRTVRDALADLPKPTSRPSTEVLDHMHQPGARSYQGHTGSPWDWPAKALKAGYHGVPGGENMLRHSNGAVRYFTVRESARLQTFPDDYELHGSWGEAMRQLGNAVPVQLANVVASSVFSALGARGATR
jgi:DNA (cytosine-5)-methyltransferase 1